MLNQQEKNQEEKPKELWEVYQINHFIDAKDNQGDWRVGYIIDKNINSRFFKIRFDGWSSKYDEFFKFTSYRLSDFRSVVVGYTGQKKNPGIRNDWKFQLANHNEKINELKSFIANLEVKTAREINQTFRGHNYFWTDFLMTRTVDSQESVASIMDYYKVNIQLTIDYLKNIDQNFTQYYKGLQAEENYLINAKSAYAHSFYEILDTMYIISGNYSRFSAFFHDNAIYIRKFLNVDHEKNVRRCYQLYILEEFIRCEGIEVFNSLLRKLLETEAVIPFLFLKSLVSLYIGLSAQLTKQDKEPYMKNFIEITKKNIKKMAEKDMKDINKNHITQLLEAIRTLFANSPEEKAIEEWTLQTEVRFCEKMIQCPFFQKKLKGVSGLIELFEKRKGTFLSQNFVKQLSNMSILQSIFSFDNVEIMKKGVQLCKMLHNTNLLQQSDIYKIWRMKVGKHEAAIREVYSFIEALPSREKNQKFSIQFFNEISKVKEEQWDEDYINFIKEYTLSAIGWVNTGEKLNNLYGFDMLQRYVIQKQNKFAFDTFIQVLDRIQKTEFIGVFMKKCFYKIQTEASSYPHVVILLKLIKQLHDFEEKEICWPEVLIKDIVKNCNDSPSKMTERFELLSLLLDIVGISLTFEEFMMLHEALSSSDNFSILLKWMIKERQGGKITINQKIPSDIITKIFDSIWHDKKNYEKITLKEAQVFIEFFKSINVHQKLIKRVNMILMVDNLKLHGLDKLWMAFEAVEDKKIAECFGSLLTQIYMCPSKKVQEQREEWVKKLIMQVSEKLRNGYKTMNIDLVSKLLIIPKKIIERDNEEFEWKGGRTIFPKQYHVTHKTTKESRNVSFNLGGLSYLFKQKVAKQFSIPIRKCKLTSKNYLIQYQSYFKTMAQCSLNNAVFEVDEEETPSIKSYLNSQLELFFELLGNPQLELSVWEIICQLPITKEQKQKMEKSEKPWEELNNSNIYKEMYVMRVMELMEQNWWLGFTKGQGLQTLGQKIKRMKVEKKIEKDYFKNMCKKVYKCVSLENVKLEIDLSELLVDLLNCLQIMLQHCSIEQSDTKSLQLPIICSIFQIAHKIGQNENPLTIIFTKPNPELLFEKGLIKASECIREQFKERFLTLFPFLVLNNAELGLNALFKKLLSFSKSEQFSCQTEQYFAFISLFIQKIEKSVIEKYFLENPNFLPTLENLLYSSTKEDSVQSVNYLLLGYLQIMKQLSSFLNFEMRNKLAHFIQFQCLFSTEKEISLQKKCKSKKSRNAAFQLLGVILVDEQAISENLIFLSELHKGGKWRTRKADDWRLTSADKEKSLTGFVGLKNLGSTCYMNSFFQQIFMIPEFRQAILKCDDSSYTKEGQAENLLFQVKKIFFNLNFSEQKYFVPSQFFNALKDYEGRPTKTNVQVDIDEFSSIFFDRMEAQMKGMKSEKIIRQNFGGVFSNEIVCRDCPHFSESEEQFLSISLNVKTKKNIDQSLETMIKGDTLDGDNAYFCQRCNKKVAAVKRVCLKALPNNLILTLKRFQFDYETMTRNKINEYCQFPLQLNLKQYSKQFLMKQENREFEEGVFDESYYEYQLTGVAVHLGYAETGHYYSIVKDRKKGEWYEFNDTAVKKFDIERLGEDTFGGQSGVFEVKQKIKNAYMLFYERKVKIGAGNKTIQDKKDQNYEKMMNEIIKGNKNKKIENILFSQEYLKFVNEFITLVPSLKPSSAFIVLKYEVIVFLTIFIRQKQQCTILNFLKKLNSVLKGNTQVCDWILKIFSSQTTLEQIFKNNPSKDSKKLLSFWLVEVIQHSTENLKQLLIDNILIQLIRSNENNNQLCFILYCLMKKESLMDYAIKKKVSGILIENILKQPPLQFNDISELKEIQNSFEEFGRQIPLQRPPPPPPSNRKQKGFIENGYSYSILCMIFQKAEKEKIDLSAFLDEKQVEKIKIPLNKVYKILQECKGKYLIKKLTQFLCYLGKQNQNYSNELINLIYKGLKEFQSKRYRQFFVLFKNMIKIKDSYSEERLKKCFSKIFKALQDNEKYTLDCNIIQQWIIKTVRKNADLQKFLLEDQEIFKYLKNLTTKKVPGEDICKKNSIFSESCVNKFHGIKMLKSKKAYTELSKEMEQFYTDIHEKKPVPANEWESDDDLTEAEVNIGDKIAYFDQKDYVEYVEAKVIDANMNRLVLCHQKCPKIFVWKDEEKLTSGNYKFNENGGDEESLGSDVTTEMDADELSNF